MVSSKKILILYTDAGGGHRATAQALQAIIKRETGHNVVLLNLYRDLIPHEDLFLKFTKYFGDDVYNRLVLKGGWSNLFCLFFYGLTLMNIALGKKNSVRRFIEYWRQEQPDLVISVMPMVNQGVLQSVKAYSGKAPVPFVVIITDFQEMMKYTWFPKMTDYYIVCGTEPAYWEILNKPHPPELTFQTSGLLVHPKFYDLPPLDIAKERQQLGLRPDLPTGCMMYGGSGSPRMKQLAQVLQSIDRKCQMIFLCGRNQALADELTKLHLPYPHVIRTYTPDVPYYFTLSDFLVSKPGPGTICEALVMNLRLVVDCQHVLPQERYNVKWVQKHQVGQPFKNLRSFRQAMQQVLDSNIATSDSRNSGKPQNQAIFEIPGIIERMLSCSALRQPIRQV